MLDPTRTTPESGSRTHPRLHDKVAFVTGGTRGIGRALVERFANEGAHVAFVGRDAKAGHEVSEICGATFMQADISSPVDVGKIMSQWMERIGRLDILVNNAGYSAPRRSVEAFDGDSLHDMLTIHLRAPWQIMSAAVPYMRASGGGSIINMASLAAHRVTPVSPAYAVSKAALVHLTRIAAAELGCDNIRVNSVSPGFIPTDIHMAGLNVATDKFDAFADAIARQFIAAQNLPIAARPEDVADICLFLASDEARFVSGADFVLDGATMWGRSRLP